VKGEKPHSFSR